MSSFVFMRANNVLCRKQSSIEMHRVEKLLRSLSIDHRQALENRMVKNPTTTKSTKNSSTNQQRRRHQHPHALPKKDVL